MRYLWYGYSDVDSREFTQNSLYTYLNRTQEKLMQQSFLAIDFVTLEKLHISI